MKIRPQDSLLEVRRRWIEHRRAKGKPVPTEALSHEERVAEELRELRELVQRGGITPRKSTYVPETPEQRRERVARADRAALDAAERDLARQRRAAVDSVRLERVAADLREPVQRFGYKLTADEEAIWRATRERINDQGF